MDQRSQIDDICREINSLRAKHEEQLRLRGEPAFWKRLSLTGEIDGLRKSLCILMGWPLDEARKGGLADAWQRQWRPDVPRETSGVTRWDVIDRLPDEYVMPIHDSDHMDLAPTWQTWREALGHPYVEGHGYCKTCGPAITCALAAFYEAVTVSVVRELNKVGLLPPPAADVPRETSTPDNGDTP